MKKHILTLLAATFLLGSCLDKDPENQIDEKGIDYTKKENMDKPVFGTYFRAAKSFTEWTTCGLMGIRTNDVYKGSDPGDQAPLSDAMNFQYIMITDYWALNDTWETLYEVAATANSALVQLDRYKEHLTAATDVKLNAQYQSEVRFLRAYSYFFITRMWGDVPMLLDNNDVFKFLTKVRHEDVLKWIDGELDLCIANDNLPDIHPKDNDGRITKYSVLALKAKVNADLAMYDATAWNEVLASTETIINSGKFELFGDYYQYFKKTGRLSAENLYELQFSDFASKDGTTFDPGAYFGFQGPRKGFKKNKVNGADAPTLAGGWGFLCPNQELLKLFNDRGETVRKRTIFLEAGTVTQEGDTLEANSGDNLYSNGKTYYPLKDITKGRTDYGIGNNVRLLRYADVLLLNAEAKVNLGQNGDAPFNLVRTRANMPPLTNVTLEQIWDERHVEFACEWGERFFDLVRTGKAEGTLKNFKKGKSEFYPIPQAQLDNNPLLK